MTTMLNPSRNGQKRPSLNEQITRLDQMLDGLADGLNEAVADAVKSALSTAVQQLVQTVLTNPEVLAKLRAALPTNTEKSQKPTIGDRIAGIHRKIRGCLTSLRAACCTGVCNTMTAARNCGRNALVRIAAGCAQVWTLRRFARQIVVALGVAAAVATAAWFSGPIVATSLSSVGAFGSTLGVQGGLWLRGLLRSTLDGSNDV